MHACILDLSKGFSTNFCLVMASAALLKLIFSTYLFGSSWPVANWSRIIYNALFSTPLGFELGWWWISPIACVILLTVGFLLISIELDEHP